MLTERVSHYRVLRQLGAGGMGVVFEAEDLRLDRHVALKFLPDDVVSDGRALDRFQCEARAASALNHPNICTIHDIDQDHGRYFIAMELLDGSTLAETIRRRPLAVPQLLDYGIQISDALAAAHAKGIIHGDLKPSNIFVTRHGEAKLLDFGLAKVPARTGEGTAETQSEVMVGGTLQYMSPEQARGEELDPRTDLFSFGAVLYEMATGRLAFSGETSAVILDAILNRQPTPSSRINPELPGALEAIIGKALDKDCNLRYQSAADIRADLQRVRRDLNSRGTITPVREPVPPVRRRWGKRLSLWSPAVAIAVFVALLVLNVGSVRDRLFNRRAGRGLSVAVLPLKNLSDDPQQDYFSDGVTEDIISHLARVPGLKVISHTSVEPYKKTSKSLRQIAGELDVDTILEGSVRREGNRVRIVAQLINARKDEHLWVETYDRDLSDVFAVQSEVAAQIANSLKADISASLKEQFDKKPTTNLEAYELYQRAKRYLETQNEQPYRSAIELLQRAVRLDPNFALAHAQLSQTHSAMWWLAWDRTPERKQLAKTAVDQALALDPDLPEAHRALGNYYYMCELNYARALEELDIAHRAKPGDADTLAAIGYVQRRQGKTTDSLATQLQSLQLDPFKSSYSFNIGETYALLRNFRDADRYFNEALVLAPDYNRAYSYKVRIRFRLIDDAAGARELLRHARTIGVGSDSYLLYQAILLEMHARRYTAALDLLSSSQADNFGEQFWYVPRPLLEAQIHELIGQKDLARKQFQEARVVLEKKILADPGDARYHSALGIALAGLGEKQTAIQEGLKAVQLMPVSKEAYRGAYRLEDLARIYAEVGEHDRAIDALERLMSINVDIGPAALKLDPAWKTLNNHPRFRELVRQQGG